MRTLRENLERFYQKLDIPRQRYALSNIDQFLLDTAHQYKIKDSFKVLDYSGDEESLKLWRSIRKLRSLNLMSSSCMMNISMSSFIMKH